MQTQLTADARADLPIPCTIAILQEDRVIAGTICGFYPHHCHVETQHPLTPGMTVSLTLCESGAAAPLKLAMGQVTWTLASESGIAFPYSSAWTP